MSFIGADVYNYGTSSECESGALGYESQDKNCGYSDYLKQQMIDAGKYVGLNCLGPIWGEYKTWCYREYDDSPTKTLCAENIGLKAPAIPGHFFSGFDVWSATEDDQPIEVISFCSDGCEYINTREARCAEEEEVCIPILQETCEGFDRIVTNPCTGNTLVFSNSPSCGYVDPDVCPDVCVPMWTKVVIPDVGFDCLYDGCGSGCGPDGIKTFDSKELCLGGVSGHDCSSDGDCDASEICFEGFCLLDEEEEDDVTGDECTTDGDCDVGMLCFDGFCLLMDDEGGEDDTNLPDECLHPKTIEKFCECFPTNDACKSSDLVPTWFSSYWWVVVVFVLAFLLIILVLVGKKKKRKRK